MKRGFEFLLMVAALFLAVFVGRNIWLRRVAAKVDPSQRPGTDEPVAGGESKQLISGVTEIPEILLTNPAKPFNKKPAVPPPDSSPAR